MHHLILFCAFLIECSYFQCETPGIADDESQFDSECSIESNGERMSDSPEKQTIPQGNTVTGKLKKKTAVSVIVFELFEIVSFEMFLETRRCHP